MKNILIPAVCSFALLFSLISNSLQAQCIEENIKVPAILMLDEEGNTFENLVASTKGVKDARIWVFDRMGNRVFQSSVSIMGAKNEEENLLDTGWDGKKNGMPLKEGTYVYSIEATCIDNTNIRRSGTIDLVKTAP